MISTNITKTLGYWCPPGLFHSYADDFWKFMGESINALNYFHEVNMEHLHWMNGKAPKDETYESNTQEIIRKDKQVYHEYLNKQLYIDIDKLNEAFGL